MKVIIYKNEDRGVSVVYPAPEFADHIEAIAAKDVPEGRPHRIIDTSELPPPDTRNSWRWTARGPLKVRSVPQGATE